MSNRKFVFINLLSIAKIKPIQLLKILLFKEGNIFFKNGLKINFSKSDIQLLERIIEDTLIFEKFGLRISFQDDLIRLGIFSENNLKIVKNPSLLYLYNLFELLRLSLQNGFIVTSKKRCLFRNIFINGQILKIYDGSKFYLDSIDPFTLVETFFFKIHDVGIWKGMTVLDIGAQAGDTAIFFARRGAKVYAVEPVSKNYEALLKNLRLNPSVLGKVITNQFALGPNKKMAIYSDPNIIDGSASLFYRKNLGQSKLVQTFSISEMIKKLGISSIDFLKVDCKGGEFLLSLKDLKFVRKCVKIEYTLPIDGRKTQKLLNLLKSAGFHCFIMNHNPRNKSLIGHGTIYGYR